MPLHQHQPEARKQFGKAARNVYLWLFNVPGVPQRVSGGQQGPSSGSGQGPLMCGQLSLGHDKQLQLQIGHHDAVKAVLTRWVLTSSKD